jgi:hypothetical protein
MSVLTELKPVCRIIDSSLVACETSHAPVFVSSQFSYDCCGLMSTRRARPIRKWWASAATED